MKIHYIIFVLLFICTTSNAMFNEASLELETKYEEVGEWEKAAENYKYFLIKNFNRPVPLIIGTFKLARTLKITGKENESKEKFEEVITLYNKYKNLVAPLTIEYVANAKFALNDELFSVATLSLKDKNMPLNAFIKAWEEALNSMKKGYDEIIQLNVREWTMASLFKIGLAYEITGYTILSFPLPEEEKDIKKEEFFLNLRNKGLPYEDRAITFYKDIITLNKKYDVGSEWAMLATQRLENLK